MFELWKMERLEKKLSSRFPGLKLSWEDSVLEITPRWGDSTNGGYQFQTKFKVYTNFLDSKDLRLICEVMAEEFKAARRLEENSLLPVVDLNTTTKDSSVYTKRIFSSDIDPSSKINLSISGTYALSSLGLDAVLELLERKIALRDRELLLHRIDHSRDILSRSLLIMPGIEADYKFYRPISREQIDHFFASKEAIRMALFLSYGKDSPLRFKDFIEASESLMDTPRSEEKLKINSAYLIVALEIFENSEIEHIGKLTSAQFLSLAREIFPGQAKSLPMHIISSRPKADFRISTAFKLSGSKVEGLNVLADFVTKEELAVLEQEVRDSNLERRLSRIALFRQYGNSDPTLHKENTVSPILSILAEIAVTRGALKYSEIVAFLEELFPAIGSNWETLEPYVRTNLIKLVCECFKDEYATLPFQWVAQFSAHSPLDLGRRIRFYKGQVEYM